MRVVVAGASGVLGAEVARALVSRGHDVVALHRRALPADLAPHGARVELARDAPPLEGADAVFSAVGASVDMTTLRGWRGYRAVDTRVNVRLIEACERAKVPRMVYVGVAGHDHYGHTPYVAAHEEVVARLSASSVRGSVVRATGFFGALAQFLPLARLGVLPNVGGGTTRSNPIHEKDLALVCADAVESGEPEIAAGGPEVLTRREMLEVAGRALEKKVWLVPVPAWMASLGSLCMRPLHPRIAQFGQFVAAISSVDCVAPRYGTHRLEDYFRELLRGRR